jgi:hypothetical protein
VTSGGAEVRLLVVLSLLVPMLVGAGDDKSKLKDRISAEIAKAQVCKTKSDCAGPLYRCPFGCNIYVNKSEIDRIKTLLASYPEDCEFKCIPVKGFGCIGGRCQTIEK